jgi:triacylglycerol esterase/lipase EstA (alpha/beta hydrolase family)
MLLSLLALAISFMASGVVADPPVVVLVHGLGGFGEEGLLFLSYWPLKDEYSKEGFVVREAAVGPVSSDWDRACELYAQIKGLSHLTFLFI